ncbi:hypothetical protein FBU59_006691, partial [Linderina macrospora]
MPETEWSVWDAEEIDDAQGEPAGGSDGEDLMGNADSVVPSAESIVFDAESVVFDAESMVFDAEEVGEELEDGEPRRISEESLASDYDLMGNADEVPEHLGMSESGDPQANSGLPVIVFDAAEVDESVDSAASASGAESDASSIHIDAYDADPVVSPLTADTPGVSALPVPVYAWNPVKQAERIAGDTARTHGQLTAIANSQSQPAGAHSSHFLPAHLPFRSSNKSAG